MKLEDIGLIGNCQFAALVHASGDVVWCCWPRFDSEPVFGKLQIYDAWNYPYVCVEPVTNANDGFNLYDQGIEGSGVFELSPGESKTATVRLHTEVRS